MCPSIGARTAHIIQWGASRRPRPPSTAATIVEHTPRTACSCATPQTSNCTCSTGYHVLLEALSHRPKRLVLVGYTSHAEDRPHAKYHDFTGERVSIDRLERDGVVRRVKCKMPAVS